MKEYKIRKSISFDFQTGSEKNYYSVYEVNDGIARQLGGNFKSINIAINYINFLKKVDSLESKGWLTDDEIMVDNL